MSFTCNVSRNLLSTFISIIDLLPPNMLQVNGMHMRIVCSVKTTCWRYGVLYQF